ncbi:MAG TPA: glycosyltransferase family 87 protein [Candidatus Limnocylindrales bacterium]
MADRIVATSRLPLVRLAIRAAVMTVFFVYLIALFRGTPWLSDPTLVGTDASNYYAAGQRLDDGHALYHLGPGDLPVPILPPLYTTPLVSPPPVAVAWRPLALLPRDVAITAWWAVAGIAAIVTTVWFTGLGSLVVTLAVLALTTELAITALSANLNTLLLGVFATIWLARRAGRPAVVGSLVAFSVAVKILPVLLVLWLLVGRRWAELAWFAVAATVIGVVSLLGAGIGAHLDWLDVARQTGTQGIAPASLPAIAQGLGLPDPIVSLVIPLTLLAGGVAIVVLRDRPGAAFAAAVVTMVLANPAVHDGSFAMLLPAFLPLARPIDPGESRAAGRAQHAQPGAGTA